MRLELWKWGLLVRASKPEQIQPAPRFGDLLSRVRSRMACTLVVLGLAGELGRKINNQASVWGHLQKVQVPNVLGFCFQKAYSLNGVWNQNPFTTDSLGLGSLSGPLPGRAPVKAGCHSNKEYEGFQKLGALFW